MSNGFALVNTEKPTRVTLVAGPDADMEDESHQPPLFRERYSDQSNVFLNADYSNQINPSANTSQWNIGSDTTKGRKNKGFFAGRIKKFTPTFIQLSQYAPNINPRNNVIEFQVYSGDLNMTTDVWVATIPPYNYSSLITNYFNRYNQITDGVVVVPKYPTATVPVWPQEVQYRVYSDTYPDPVEYPTPTWAPFTPDIKGNPKDGLIDHILTAMNNAVHKVTGVKYNPTAAGYGQFKASFSNGYGYNNVDRIWDKDTLNVTMAEENDYGRIWCDGIGVGGAKFFRMVGGNTFQKGLHAWGCRPLPNLEAGQTIFQNAVNPFNYSYTFGPAQFQYSRWIDIVMPELLQFSKMQTAGSGVPANLLARLYSPKLQNIGLENVILSDFRQQQINMRKDFALSYLNIEIRDEYGELFEVPGQLAVSTAIDLSGVLNWPNASGISIGLCAQL